MSVKLLTEHHLEFLRLKGGCTGLSESTLVKMPHCWKSHVPAHMGYDLFQVGKLEEIQEIGQNVEALRDNGILVDAEADPGELLNETESTTEETR